MIGRKALLTDLRRQLKRLEQDLAERADTVPEMTSILQEEYRAARDAERTGDTFLIWRTGALSQAAVAWLLGCVFVRFAEDNGLVDVALIAGPGERNARAEDRQTLYFRARPTDSDRDYLLDVFAEAARLPGIGPLYDRVHNPVWRYGISGDAARDLLAFWRAVDPDTGALRHDFTDREWDTRFVGDLYQDLSDEAKKRFALLQTPEFVEEFILDRTLTPALDEFGLPGIRLIDPACGSGHFLLGAFARVLRAWFNREPGTPERVLVQRALDGVYCVDINPFAAAIAQFRLLVAALRGSRVERLKDAPNFQIHIAAGDSLLHGRRFGELDLGSGAEQFADREEFGHAYLTEDLKELNRILGQQYHVVVGNPPYVTVNDVAVNKLYRARFSTCHRQYSLAVPFAERAFDLALTGQRPQLAGYVGLITANSFMKREFGKKLVESFLPHVDLTHVLDTSGAYIPGHGTPTVVLFGRHRSPVGDSVRTVMGIRGEPATPTDPSRGLVWLAIVGQIDTANSESDWANTEDISRKIFAFHPWSIGGGGARQVQDSLAKACIETLGDISTEIGRTTHTGEDGAYYFSSDGPAIREFKQYCMPLVTGEDVRNWALDHTRLTIFPFEGVGLKPWKTIPSSLEQHFWRLRTKLRARLDFGQSIEQRGLNWFEHSMFFKHRYSIPFSIVIAFVATNNHFVFDRGGKVFKQTAPAVKLPADATESEHLAIVGLLNSSVACFWMKQAFHNKGSTVDAHGARQTTDAFGNFYEYTATGLKQFPLPAQRPIALAEALDRLASERQAHLPTKLIDRFPMAPRELDAHRDMANDLLTSMIALQEELDWQCYQFYGVIEEDCRCAAQESTIGCLYNDDMEPKATSAYMQGEPPPLSLGARAFEILMARRMAAGELETTWFTRHDSTPITELPTHWPAEYGSLVERRIDLIATDRYVGLIERPEYKRRWNVEPWDNQEQRALRTWLLNRLESPAYWPATRLATVRSLAEWAATDTDFQRVAARFAGHAGVDVGVLVKNLVESESVPALPVQRYKAAGLAKRADWQLTWSLQRREDEIDAEVQAVTPRREDETEEQHATRIQTEQRRRKQREVGDLTPPPKYRSADFLKPAYWRLRGALDVPKERFVSFPTMSRDNDPALLVGWAGWNALELCQAVATYCAEVIEQDGWPPERLIPLLAVLQENLPWVKQWHNEVDPEYNQRLGDFFETYLHTQLSHFGLTEVDLRAWAPPVAIRKASARQQRRRAYRPEPPSQRRAQRMSRDQTD